MMRGGPKSVSKAVQAGAVLMVLALIAVWRLSVLSSHTAIQDLRQLPVGSRVHIAGVITYVDAPGKRLWLQDETGALPVDLPPSHRTFHVGQTVSVDGEKTAQFDAARGPVSIGLRGAKIGPTVARVKLPAPSPVEPSQFPAADKNGIQVEVRGVVRSARRDNLGRGVIEIAARGPAIQVIVAAPAGDYAKLINADVRVTGVPEKAQDANQSNQTQTLWVPAQPQVELEHAAPLDTLYTLRSLYMDKSAESGHRVRVRGTVAANDSASLVVEEARGTLDCDLDEPADLPPGTPVEVDGFPAWEGLRIRLVHVRAHAVASVPAVEDQTSLNLPELTTVRAIRELSPASAAVGYPVRIHGVITYVDPLWRQMYVQDATGGIYMKYAGHAAMKAGMAVTVSGFSNAGNFAPVVVAPRLKLEGGAPLPKPIVATPEIAAAGRADAEYVELEGLVHPIRKGADPRHPIATFELFGALGQVHVYTSPSFPDTEHMQRLEGARVRLRGVLGTLFNSRRQLMGYQLLVENPSSIEVLEPAQGKPFDRPATPIADLLRFSPNTRYGHRVKVAGTVTYVRPESLFLEDGSSGVEIRGDTRSIHVGDAVEALGYPTLVGRYSPVLTDATYRGLPRRNAVEPKTTSAEALLQGSNDSMLVALDARLLMTVRGPTHTTLVMRSGVRTFAAQIDSSELGGALGVLRDGSVLRLTGVCATQVDPSKLYTLSEHDPIDFELLLRSQKDIALVRAAPMWTMRTTLILLALLLLLIPPSLVWVALLRRRVQMQNAALARAAETSQAIQDLSQSIQSVTWEQRFDAPVSVRGAEEIAQLVVGFNRMLQELQLRERDKVAAEAKLQHMAMVDELTGLPNRRLLFDRLSQSLARARRDRKTLGVLYVDLDGFKLVNDNLGHAVGDLLLVEVANRLRMRSRASDTVARIGGDEFILVLDQLDRPEDALSVARNLLEALQAQFTIEGQTLRIAASIGISLYPNHGVEGEILLQQADCAMYAAKNNGKNQIVQYEPHLGHAARTRMTMEGELRRAVADHSISVHYQPEYSLTTHSVVRFEALARWTHPELGPISPLQFITLAEESGLIVQLGAQILEQACSEAVGWQRVAGHDVQVAVNVSSVQFARETFVDEVAQTLRRTGLRGDLLQLELTESAALAGIERSTAVIERLKAMGVSVAIDDFGTGYSCLSYLPRLPFDALKIDRSFVNQLSGNAEFGSFLRSIVAMAHNLNMKVIVEGVESEKELRMVTELGADEGQGYLLGRPSAEPLLHLKRASQLWEKAVAQPL